MRKRQIGSEVVMMEPADTLLERQKQAKNSKQLVGILTVSLNFERASRGLQASRAIISYE